MLKKINQISLRCLKSLGIFTIVQSSNWRQQRLLILAYHGISLEDEHLWNPDLYMHPDLLRARMQMLLDRGCTVLPLNEAVQRLYAGDLPNTSVVITFDDGYFDFYERAMPILEKYNIPATLYLTTMYTNYAYPVFDAICPYLFWKGKRRQVSLKKLIGKDITIDLSTQDGRNRAGLEVIKAARNEKLSIEQKNDLAAELAMQLDLDYDLIQSKRILQLLNPHEVRQLTARGIDVQLHTHHHRAPFDRQAFFDEINHNRQSIQNMTGLSAQHFCYPSGIYKSKFFPWLRELSVISATTVDFGLASRDTPHLLLPRFVDSSMQSSIEFEGWLTGIASVLPLPRRRPSIYVPKIAWEFTSYGRNDARTWPFS